MDTAQSHDQDAGLAAAFGTDGVVHVPSALSPATMGLAEQAYDWSLANPGPGAARLPAKGDGEFFQDLANPAAFEAYDALIRQPEIGALIARLWQAQEVWFMYEQVFKKSGGVTRRTPWHQDTPYLPVSGDQLAVMWISFDEVPRDRALEFVAGSHRGVLYDGSRFDPDDDTAPIYGDGSLPRLPDIEAHRDAYPIQGWATRPGDVLVFHPSILHGGGDTDGGFTRRTLSLRFFGADAVVARRPGAKPPETASADQPNVHPLNRMRAYPDGSAFHDPAFPRIH